MGRKPQVTGHIPKQINTRAAVFVAPAENYLAPGETFGGDIQIRVDVYVLVTVTDNAKDDAALDDLLTNVWPAVASWVIEHVDEPDVYKFGDWAMYGTRFTLTTTTPR